MYDFKEGRLEARWLTDEEVKRLDGLGLDRDGDIDPYSGAVVFLETIDVDNWPKAYRGIISTTDADITRVPLITFGRHPEIYEALSQEDKEKLLKCFLNRQRQGYQTRRKSDATRSKERPPQ